MNTCTDQMGRAVQAPAHPQRIISLVPSQTELLFDLGLGERVVGITKFCIHPEAWFRSKPRVGGTKNVDLAKLRTLKPDLIIGNKEENERADIEALEREFPVWMSEVNDLDGALGMVRGVGTITGTHSAAEALASRIAAGFAQLHPCPTPLRVAYLIWRKPYMAAGAGTFVHDMLLRCGFVNAYGDRPGRYPIVEDLAAHASEGGAPPEVVLLSSEPYPFKGPHLEDIQQALPQARVLLVDGEAFCWYGSRLLQSPAYFHALIPRLDH